MLYLCGPVTKCIFSHPIDDLSVSRVPVQAQSTPHQSSTLRRRDKKNETEHGGMTVRKEDTSGPRKRRTGVALGHWESDKRATPFFTLPYRQTTVDSLRIMRRESI